MAEYDQPPSASMPDRAYDRWAWLYDELYEGRFGEAYPNMTAQHLAMIEPYLRDRRGGLLDAGAGSGRISIPIALQGFPVTAIDPSEGMLERLDVKARTSGVRGQIAIFCRPLEAPTVADTVRNDHDAAICAFSTIHHLTDPSTLDSAFRAVAAALRPGGTALVGVHPAGVFSSFEEDPMTELRIGRLGGTVRWTQSIRRRTDGDRVVDFRNLVELPDGRAIEDRFPLMPWTADEIVAAASGSGLVHEGTEVPIGSECVLRFWRKHDGSFD
jgi:SAM-dependent methyltransferase